MKLKITADTGLVAALVRLTTLFPGIARSPGTHSALSARVPSLREDSHVPHTSHTRTPASNPRPWGTDEPGTHTDCRPTTADTVKSSIIAAWSCVTVCGTVDLRRTSPSRVRVPTSRRLCQALFAHEQAWSVGADELTQIRAATMSSVAWPQAANLVSRMLDRPDLY